MNWSSNARDSAGSGMRLVLFVAGDELNSKKARTNLRRFCDEQLAGKCKVDVVDVLEDHRQALNWKVLLTPALLIFQGAERPIRITGNLDDTERVRTALGIRGQAHGA